MKWKTASGKLKEIPMHRYLVDWDDDQDSQFSAEVLDFFEPYWQHDVVCAQVPVAGSKMSYDYVNVTKRLVLECDGRQHTSFVPHFHTNRANFQAQVRRDFQKDDLAERNGFTMIRIRPDNLPLTKTWLESTFDVTL